jgi:hypothetical protein
MNLPPSSAELSLPEKIVAIHASLDEAHVNHAFGGALALAYYAEPRATIDVDVNVFVPTRRWLTVRDALEPLGVKAMGLDLAALDRDGQCRLWWGRTPLDLFFSYGEIHDEMARQTRRVPFGDVTLPVLGPEHLAVCKAMYDRPKDWLDIEQMLVATEKLDLAEVEEWLVRMVGEQDPRLERLKELKALLAIGDLA